MSKPTDKEQQAKSVVLKLSAIVTFASLGTALAAQHVGFAPAYSYSVAGLGALGAILHICVRVGVLKPQPLEMPIDDRKETKSREPFWLTKFINRSQR